MKSWTMTIETLEEFLDSAEFRNLPAALAIEDTQGQPWEDVLEGIGQWAAKVRCWELIQMMGLLLSTYPGVIERISSGTQYKSCPANGKMVVFYPKINGDTAFGLDEMKATHKDLFEACGKTDGGRTLQWFMERLTKIGQDNIMVDYAFDLFRLNETVFTKPQQTRLVAQLAAPEIQAWWMKKALTDCVVEQKRAEAKLMNM